MTAFSLVASSAEAAPSNDDFANAGAFGSVPPGNIFTSNEGATKQLGEPNHAGDPGGHSVWFSWTPQVSGTAEIATCTDGSLDTLLAVYTGAAVDALTPVASSDDAAGSCEPTDSVVQFGAQAGTTYKIAVDGKGGAEGHFALRLRGRPANDDFSRAEVLPPTFGVRSQFGATTRFATKEPGEPDHAGDPGGASVWYSWTPTASGPVDLDTCGSEFDTLLAVYEGASVDNLTSVAANDNRPHSDCGGVNAAPLTSEIRFDAVAGRTYHIAVDGKGGASRFFELRLNGGPGNDNFAKAQTISATPQFIVDGTNRLATKQPGEPDHAGAGGSHSVWYSWTPAVTEPIRIASCSAESFQDPVIAVYTGSAVDALTPVASGDDGAVHGCTAADAEVHFKAEAGTTYRIAVDAVGEHAQFFELQFFELPRNDDFAAAATLSLAGSASGDNTFATKQPGEPNHAGDPGGHSVWYTWTPQLSGQVHVSVCPEREEFEPLLGIYTGSSVDTLTPVPVSASDAADCKADELNALAGTTYRIAVDGKAGSVGSFSIRIRTPQAGVPAPANDDFADAETFFGFAIGENVLATKQPGEPDHAGDPGGRSVWYSWTPDVSGQAVITACTFESEFEPLLAVYTGSSLGQLQPIASGEEASQECGASGSQASFEVSAGTTYRIAVDGTAGEEGGFVLTAEATPALPPGNDDFGRALPLNSPLPAVVSGDNTRATKQSGEPNHAGDPGGHSVWYSWTAPASGDFSVSTCSRSATLDPLLALYTGPSVDNLTPVASNDDATDPLCQVGDAAVVLHAVAGTTYEIAVDGKAGSVGNFLLQIQGRLGNDDFADAARLGSSEPTASFGSTGLATKEPGEPDHAGDPGGHSVWFSWTAPVNGPVDVSVCPERPTFEPLLAAYTGQAVGALTPVGSPAALAGSRCSLGGREVSFDAVAGTTYKFAVDGKGGTSGGFLLVIDGVPANDDFGNTQALSGLPTELAVPESSRFASKQMGEPDHAGNPGGASIWFKWTAPRSGPVSLSTCGSNFDTLLTVYTGSSLAGLNPVQSNDDAGGSCGFQSRASFDATAGVSYKIAVDGKGDAQGLVHLGIDGRPANDDLGKARALLAALPRTASGSTALATKQPGEPDHAGVPGGHSVWFSWTPSRSREVSVDTCGSDFDTLLSVYTGSDLGSLTPIASNDNGSGACAPASSLTFDAIAGTEYKIAVDGVGADQGQVALQLDATGPVKPILSVSRSGNGSGAVVSNPAGIDCGPSCNHGFDKGAEVTLTATAATGSRFAGWSGGGCSGAGSCRLTLSSSQSVDARFEVLPGGEEEKHGDERPGSPPPSNEFRFGRLRLNRSRGTAILTVFAPSPGVFAIAGKGIRAVRAVAQGAGSVEVVIKPTGAAAARLARTGEAHVSAKVSFTPSGGLVLTKARPLTLRKRLGTH
jgi:hypothetical protein